MASLSSEFLGIRSPNPFWLASAPPTDKKLNVVRAFEAGWGGVVWKTLGDQVRNVSSRYAANSFGGHAVAGLNNIELISDRPLSVNLKEIVEVVKEWPDRAMVVSLMANSTREDWHELVKRTQDTGCHGLELNFGCPHGMNERGMGSAVGQDPDIARLIVGWVMEVARIPVIVKLTPNVHSVVPTAAAVIQAGTGGLSLINTIQSVMGIDLDTLVPRPNVGGLSTYGGYCGPAVKPIALKMLASLGQDARTAGVPVSGIGGIGSWQDAAEFMLLGAGTVQVCTAVMTHGFSIIRDLCDGLSGWMDDKGYTTLEEFRGLSLPRLTTWEGLDLNFHITARINEDTCIGCGKCHIACEDAAHQAIAVLRREHDNRFRVIDAECVGCNLCQLVCPVDGCITMVEQRHAPDTLRWPEYMAGNPPLERVLPGSPVAACPSEGNGKDNPS